MRVAIRIRPAFEEELEAHRQRVHQSALESQAMGGAGTPSSRRGRVGASESPAMRSDAQSDAGSVRSAPAGRSGSKRRGSSVDRSGDRSRSRSRHGSSRLPSDAVVVKPEAESTSSGSD